MGLTKLKAFVYDNVSDAKMIIFVFDRIESILEKRRKCLSLSSPSLPKNVFKTLCFRAVKT